MVFIWFLDGTATPEPELRQGNVLVLSSALCACDRLGILHCQKCIDRECYAPRWDQPESSSTNRNLKTISPVAVKIRPYIVVVEYAFVRITTQVSFDYPSPPKK